MTRLKQAWLALCGKLEPEVREVKVEIPTTILGTPEEVVLYEVVIPRRGSYGITYEVAECRYLTCEQAHAEHPGSRVVQKSYWRIGDVYLRGLQVERVEVQPKPKIAKGKRK